MAVFHWIGRLIAGAWRLALKAFFGVVTLFGASLNLMLGIVSQLYDRFDAGFSNLAAESRQRRGAKGRIAAPAE